MMYEWLVGQLDYTLFLCGLSFFLLSSVARSSGKQDDSGPAWHYLAAFGLMRGLSEWLDMLTLSIGDSFAFRSVRLALLVFSFLVLVEFGRRGADGKGSPLIGPWLTLLLGVLAASGALFGGMGALNTTCRYALGLPGGVLAGYVMWRESGRTESVRNWPLRLAGIAMALYGLVTGLMATETGVSSAWRTSTQGSPSLGGAAHQVILVICAVVTALGIWWARRRNTSKSERTGTFRSRLPSACAIVLLIGGGWIVGIRGDSVDRQMRRQFELQAQAVARAINPADVKALSFTDADKDNPRFHRLESQMTAYARAMGYHGLRCVAVRNGRCVLGPGSLIDDTSYNLPAGTICDKSTQELTSSFRTSRTFTRGPVRDEHPSFVSGFAPVRDPRTGEVLLTVRLDVEAGNWRSVVARQRLISILFVLVLLAILTAGWVMLRRRRHSPQKGGRWLRHAEVWLTAGSGLALTGAGAYLGHEEATHSRGQIFSQVADLRAEEIMQCFRDVQEHYLPSVVRFCEEKTDVSREEFRRFVSPISSTPFVSGVGWTPRIEFAQKDAFEAKVRADGEREFFIYQRDATGRCQPVTTRDAYYPLLHHEPRDEHPGAMGLDLFSDTQRRFAIEETARTGLVTATDVIRTADGLEWCIVVYAPLLARGVESDGARHITTGPARLQGVVGLGLRLPLVVGRAFNCPDKGRSATSILYLLKGGEAPRVLASAPPAGPEGPVTLHDCLHGDFAGLSAIYPVFAFGQAYVMVIRPGPAFLAEHPVRVGWAVGVMGLLLTAVMTAFVGFVSTRRASLERQVQKRTEALQASEARLRSITDSAQDAVLMMDPQGNISYWNPAAEGILGHLRDEAIGRNLHDLIAPKQYVEAHRLALQEFCRSGRGAAVGKTLELQARRKDGQEITVALSMSAVQIEGGWHAVGILRDITVHKRVEEAIRGHAAAMKASNEQLEQAIERTNQMALAVQMADVAKSEFLANMSHEIRTPMTAILGYSELVAESLDCCTKCPVHTTCETRKVNGEYMQTVHRNGEHLLGLINDILDLSKIEAGKMTVELVSCSPHQITMEAVSLVQVRAQTKGLTLETQFLGPVPETVRTDPLRLRQILVNLLGNALKFTEKGSVTLLARLITDGDEPRMQFDVVDTGIGMTDRQSARVFQPFSQAEASTARRFGGSGLGLVISKQLAQMLGGDVILVESRPGIGTRFRASVATGPLNGIRMVEGGSGKADATAKDAATLEFPPKADTTKALEGVRILLAEDGPDNQRLIAHVLKKAGADVTVAEDGQIAVDKTRAAGQPFDVVLMDMQMPVLDGYEATKVLRNDGYTGPIIALTAHAMTSDRDKCLDAGCDAYASKPIDRTKLIETIHAQIQRSHDGTLNTHGHGGENESPIDESDCAGLKTLGREIESLTNLCRQTQTSVPAVPQCKPNAATSTPDQLPTPQVTTSPKTGNQA